MDIASGLTAATHALSIAKSIKDAEKALDAATLKARLAELISELADVKIAQVALMEKVHDLQSENERLRNIGPEFDQLGEENGYFYRKEGNGLIGWPACPSCFSIEKKVTYLVQNGNIEDAKCPHCKTEFTPVTSYLSPGFSRTDQRRQRAEQKSRETRAVMERMNRSSSWMA